MADRQLGQGGQVACEDTWNTTVDDQTPVRFYLFWLVKNNGFLIGRRNLQLFFRNQVKRGANNSSKVSLLNLQDQQEVTANQNKPKASQSDTNMTKMQNLEEAHLALSVSRSRIEHQENILAALENRVSSLFNDSGEFSKIKLFGDHGNPQIDYLKRDFQIDADQLVPWLVEREVPHWIENPSHRSWKLWKLKKQKLPILLQII